MAQCLKCLMLKQENQSSIQVLNIYLNARLAWQPTYELALEGGSRIPRISWSVRHASLVSSGFD